MLSYEIAQESLIFKWDDDESITGQRYRTIKFSSYIAAPALVAFAEAIVAICNRQAIVSSTSCIYAGRFIFEHIARQKKEFPPNRDGWDNFLLTHYECHLRFTDTRLENRVKVWTAITAIYRRLQRKGFIPDDAYIPNESSSIGLLDESLEQPLGHEIVNVTPPKSFDYLLPKKYLVESGLSMADDEYLLGLKRTLELRASTILSCCTDYWDRMLSCHEKGKEIYSAISNQRVEDILNSGKYYVDGYHLGDLETPNGIFWFLAVARHYITKTEKLKTTSMVNLCRLPFYQGILSKERKKNLFSKKIISLAEDSKTQPLQFSEALSRLLGLLSPRDCAVACAILASENPRFNPTSLTNVRLYSKNGTFYLRGNSDTKRITLSVSKPRARSRKESVLPPLSAKIVTDVINCTQTARSHLISERKSGWRKLFLTSTRRKLGRYASFITALNTARGLTLIHMYKAEFEKIGISSDLLTLFRIRCTQGILEFLRNGSIQRVADLLGNTFAVVERCYIPRWLKYRWGTRLLRVLQQKIILVATEGEPWQVTASDFITEEDMQGFIRHILLGLKKGDALSEAIRTKLGHYSPEANSVIEMFIEHELLLNRSPIGFAAIYAYAEAVQDLPEAHKLLTDKYTQLPLWIFTTLKQLITQTTELDFDNTTDAESSIADRISGDSLSELKKTHKLAMELSQKFRALIHIDTEHAT